MTTPSPMNGFSHVQLHVSDVAASEQWWATVLGLERLTASDDGSYVALRHMPSKVVVVLSAAGDRPLRNAGTLDHLAFGVADGPTLQQWASALRRRGIEHNGVVDELGKPSLVLTDPDGNSVELVAPPGSW